MQAAHCFSDSLSSTEGEIGYARPLLIALAAQSNLLWLVPDFKLIEDNKTSKGFDREEVVTKVVTSQCTNTVVYFYD